jgi:hypothetical protein
VSKVIAPKKILFNHKTNVEGRLLLSIAVGTLRLEYSFIMIFLFLLPFVRVKFSVGINKLLVLHGRSSLYIKCAIMQVPRRRDLNGDNIKRSLQNDAQETGMRMQM